VRTVLETAKSRTVLSNISASGLVRSVVDLGVDAGGEQRSDQAEGKAGEGEKQGVHGGLQCESASGSIESIGSAVKPA
jgi:hypothetical protein